MTLVTHRRGAGASAVAGCGRPRQHDGMSWYKPWRNFRADPSSLRSATLVIMALTVLLVLVGGVLMRAFASHQYPTFGDAFWFMLQTVTTVGYGDNPPSSTIGRVVASVVMLTAIGLTTVITAVVTSMFIQSARAARVGSRDQATAESLARIEASLEATRERLDRIEAVIEHAPVRGGER